MHFSLISIFTVLLFQASLGQHPVSSPETLTLAEIQEEINVRKQIWTDEILNNREPELNNLPVFIQNNVSFDFDAVAGEILANLEFEIDPDFFLITFVRILFMTEDFNEPILESVQKIRLWVTVGESTRIYWTENHQIMYSAVAYLLRQKFGEDFFEPGFFDEHLDARLNWFLTTKPETGLFEFNSPIYFQFTTAGLLLLHDFAEDPDIKQGALNCLHRIIEDFMLITSSSGLISQSSARSYNIFYFTDESMFINGGQEVVAFLTGLGPLISSSGFTRAAITALILSDADLTPAIATYRPQVYNIRQVGLDEAQSETIFGQLPDFERNIAQLTMGLYASVNVVNDLFDFVSFYELADREDFEPFAVLQTIPTDELREQVAASLAPIAEGISYYVPELVTYKDSNVVMTSCNHYFPGFKGYQQYHNMALIENTTVFTYAMPEALFLDPIAGQTQLLGNNQFPYLKQQFNVLVAIYNPDRNLAALGVEVLDVLFYFEASFFEQVVDEGNWVFGKLNDAYVGVYREQCLSPIEDHLVTTCTDEVQIWITVVGTAASHNSFDAFRTSALNSEIYLDIATNCGRARGTIDGQVFNDTFCQGDFDIVSDDDTEEESETDDEDDVEDIFDFSDLISFVPFVIATFIVLLVLYVVSKCFCFKESEDQLEENTAFEISGGANKLVLT